MLQYLMLKDDYYCIMLDLASPRSRWISPARPEAFRAEAQRWTVVDRLSNVINVDIFDSDLQQTHRQNREGLLVLGVLLEDEEQRDEVMEFCERRDWDVIALSNVPPAGGVARALDRLRQRLEALRRARELDKADEKYATDAKSHSLFTIFLIGFLQGVFAPAGGILWCMLVYLLSWIQITISVQCVVDSDSRKYNGMRLAKFMHLIAGGALCVTSGHPRLLAVGIACASIALGTPVSGHAVSCTSLRNAVLSVRQTAPVIIRAVRHNWELITGAVLVAATCVPIASFYTFVILIYLAARTVLIFTHLRHKVDTDVYLFLGIPLLTGACVHLVPTLSVLWVCLGHAAVTLHIAGSLSGWNAKHHTDPFHLRLHGTAYTIGFVLSYLAIGVSGRERVNSGRRASETRVLRAMTWG